MKNQKNKVTLPLAQGNFKTAFEIEFFAENAESKTSMLTIDAFADEQTNLATLLGKALNLFEIKAPELLRSKRIVRTEYETIKDEAGKSTGMRELKTRLRAIKAKELFVSFRVVSNGQNWQFGTFERVPVPFNGSLASMNNAVGLLLDNLYSTLAIHALTDESAAKWINETFERKGLNKAESLQLRKDKTRQLLAFPVSDLLTPMQSA